MIYHEGNCNDPCSSPLRSTGGRVGSYGYNQELYLLSPLRLEKFFIFLEGEGGGYVIFVFVVVFGWDRNGTL